MTGDWLTIAALLAAAIVLDGLVRPRPQTVFAPVGRSLAGLWLLVWMMAALIGLFLAISGNALVSGALAVALLALLALVSNAKHAMLGEPLLFSDLALIGAIFRHPQFYLSAIKVWQRICAGAIAGLLLVIFSLLFVPYLWPHLAGGVLLVGGLAMLAISVRIAPFNALAREPDAYADVRRHGLFPSLLLYWLRWRQSRDPAPCAPVERRQLPAVPETPELVIIVQCESFADPVELFTNPGLALPALSEAKRKAWQWGQLDVYGFGAYTMRTEYGVLFGRSEAALGFRRYDPFLTALGETSYAMPMRLRDAGWRSLFVHPHDMRFYNRDRLMPASGFDVLVGEDRFAPVSPGAGRYVADTAVAAQIASLARDATERTLIYAVTIENHGPWAPEASAEKPDLVQSYLRLVRNSDAMLASLLDEMAALRRPAMLVFFGDHRPSIPGATAPGEALHTPYVMMRVDAAGRIVPGENRRVDLTPAELHHAVLDALLGDAVFREKVTNRAA